MCLCFRNKKKTISWRQMIGQFKFRAENETLTLVLFIIFVVYYILTCVNWFSWQALLLAKHMTWVRAPGLQYSQYYFSISLHMQFHLLKTMIHLLIKPATRMFRAIQRCRLEEHHKHKSTRQHTAWKSQKGQLISGPGLLQDAS